MTLRTATKTKSFIVKGKEQPLLKSHPMLSVTLPVATPKQRPVRNAELAVADKTEEGNDAN